MVADWSNNLKHQTQQTTSTRFIHHLLLTTNWEVSCSDYLLFSYVYKHFGGSADSFYCDWGLIGKCSLFKLVALVKREQRSSCASISSVSPTKRWRWVVQSVMKLATAIFIVCGHGLLTLRRPLSAFPLSFYLFSVVV